MLVLISFSQGRPLIKHERSNYILHVHVHQLIINEL